MSPQRFRKKPVEVEAIDTFEVLNAIKQEQVDLLPEWVRKALSDGILTDEGGQMLTALHIRTLEGVMTADYYWKIIQGVHGELYPCKPDIFAETYEAVK